MSHVVETEPDGPDQGIRDLYVLKKAAERCGLVFNEGQTHFRTWADDHNGRLVGDWPLPEGRTLDDVGKCAHALSLPNAAKSGVDSYEIGVVESKKHPGTYSLMYDFWRGALEKKAGNWCEDLLMYYQMEAAKLAAEEQDHTYVEEQLADGTFVARVEVN